MQSILITGVSSGIGYDLVREFVSHGYRVYGSVRNKKDAEPLKAEYGEKYKPLFFDVTDKNSISDAVSLVRQELDKDNLKCLINNAGIAIFGPIIDIDNEEFRKQIEVNLFGVLSVTKAFLPLLRGDKPGRIINISSVSGKRTFPYLGAYAASKHALEAFSDALRYELALYGIKTIIIEPGSTQSSIWSKGPDSVKYQNTDYYDSLNRVSKVIEKSLRNILPTERVSKVVIKAFKSKNPKNRYLIIHNKLINWWIPRLLPEKVMDKIFIKMMFDKIK